jgi:hypothetical protein
MAGAMALDPSHAGKESPMAMNPQRSLFSWSEIESSSDLDRLRLVLDVLPDEPFMRTGESRPTEAKTKTEKPGTKPSVGSGTNSTFSSTASTNCP